MAQPALIILPDPVSEKTCTKCGQIKVFSEFAKDTQKLSGIRNWCKLCCSKYAKNWRDKNPQHREQKRLHYHANIEESRKRDRIHYYSHLRDHKNSRLKYQFGITIKQYEDMLAAQKNRCLICGDAPKTVLVVDHCHATGKVRGLLCSPCNTSLGGFKDNPRLLQAAITYLEIKG